MTIASTTNRNDYVGNGAVSVYSYTFKIFAETDLLVTQRDTDDVETTLVLTTDYTVSGVGETSGGSITLVAGNLTTGYALTIRRVRPLTQETDIRNQGDFFANTHEDQFDDSIMIAQQQQNEIDRSLQLAETETGVSTTLPIAEALKWPRWNSAGTALENISGADLSVVTTFGADLTLASNNLSVTIPNRFGVAGGTVDVITAVTSPVVASLTNNLAVIIEAAGANATTTPTFSPDGMTAKTIVKGNDTALVVGNIPGANYRMHLVYDSSLDKWVLLNPADVDVAEDIICHGLEIIGVAAAANFTVNAGKLLHGTVRIDKTADVTLTFATAADWWDGATDDYSGGAGWCYVGVDSSGNVKLLGANPPDKTDVSGNSAGELLYWYDSSLYWRVIGAVFVNTSNQVSFALNGVGRHVVILENEVLDNGTQSGSPASVDCSAVIPANAKKVHGYYESNNLTGNAGVSLFSTNAELGKITIVATVTATSLRMSFELILVESQTIYYEMEAGTNVSLFISGWSYD